MNAHILIAASAGSAEFRLSPDVAVVVMDDGSARVLDMADRFYSIPASGTVILRGVLDGGIDAAAGRLAEAFQIDEDRARADAERFVETLAARGMLLRTGESVRPPRSFAAELLARLMRAALLLPALELRAFALLTLSRISCALCGWTATVAAWTRRLPPVVDFPRRDVSERIADIETAVARQAARHVLGMECKERSLTCWALTRAAGLPASMVIGADFYPLAGHVWCEAAGRTISDDPQNCRRYQRLLCYG